MKLDKDLHLLIRETEDIMRMEGRMRESILIRHAVKLRKLKTLIKPKVIKRHKQNKYKDRKISKLRSKISILRQGIDAQSNELSFQLKKTDDQYSKIVDQRRKMEAQNNEILKLRKEIENSNNQVQRLLQENHKELLEQHLKHQADMIRSFTATNDAFRETLQAVVHSKDKEIRAIKKKYRSQRRKSRVHSSLDDDASESQGDDTIQYVAIKTEVDDSDSLSYKAHSDRI